MISLASPLGALPSAVRLHQACGPFLPDGHRVVVLAHALVLPPARVNQELQAVHRPQLGILLQIPREVVRDFHAHVESAIIPKEARRAPTGPPRALPLDIHRIEREELPRSGPIASTGARFQSSSSSTPSGVILPRALGTATKPAT